MTRRSLHPAVSIVLALLVCCATAHAQQRPAKRPQPRLASLARLAPEQTGVFIEFERLDRLNEQLRTVNAWRVVELLGGGSRTAGETAEPVVDWGDVLAANLGVSPAVAFDDLFSRQVALAAPDWEHLDEGVILLRPANREALNHLVGPGKVRRTTRSGSRVKVYETKAGLRVATDGRVVILSQRSEETPFYRHALDLLAGKSIRSLARLGLFRDRMRRLPPGRHGAVYFTARGTRRSGPAADNRPQLLSAFRRGVIGVYARDDRVDLVFRFDLVKPRESSTWPRVAAPRPDRLPQTTILAWATSFHLRQTFQTLIESPSSHASALLGTLLSQVLDPRQLEHNLLAKLGPRAIVVWGQDLEETSPVPQLAVLLESPDAAGAAAALEQAAEALLARLGKPAGDNESPSTIARAEHLGTIISTVPFEDMIADAPAGSLVAKMRGLLRPSFAPLDGWLAMALTPEHLRRIIDANRGVVPSLGSAQELAWTAKPKAGVVVFALAQPAWAAQVMLGWLDLASRGNDTFMATLLDLAQQKPVPRRKLGIGMRTRHEPGRVFVACVYPGTPAAERLQPGDEVVGVDGRVLSLSDPNADLRGVVEGVEGSRTITLRVLREQVYLDVPVQLGGQPAVTPTGGTVEVLHRLARAAQDIHWAAYTEMSGRPDQYVARLTLAFRPVVPGPEAE